MIDAGTREIGSGPITRELRGSIGRREGVRTGEIGVEEEGRESVGWGLRQ